MRYSPGGFDGLPLLEIANETVFGNRLDAWFSTALFFIISAAVIIAIRHLALARLKSLSKRTSNKLDDAIVAGAERVGWPFYVFVSLAASATYVGLGGFGRRVIDLSTLAAVLFYAVRFLQFVIEGLVERYAASSQKNGKAQDPTILYFFAKLGGYLLWLVAALVLVDNAGYDITALIAGLGVAGIAIALGLQNILSDIFSSLSIYFDKPFKVGDFIILGTDMGVVKRIGIKTTRLQALQGEEIVISNRELTESRIHNFGKMSQRRVEFRFNITYETPLGKIKKVNELVKRSIHRVEGARLDRVHFKKFGEYSLDFEAVYYFPNANYNAYMDAQQTINYSLIELFSKEGIEFAYPLQRIMLSQEKEHGILISEGKRPR